MAQFFSKSASKIVCVGRNYVKHCLELGNEIPDKPLLFFKPKSSMSFPSSPILVPSNADPYHYEVELVVLIGKEMSKTPAEAAMDYVEGYTLAIDVTDRTCQKQEAKTGSPWTFSKGQDGFAPIMDKIIPKAKIDIDDTEIWLSIDGKTKQKSNINDMIFKIPYLLSYISRWITLVPGDLVFTGTPSGVGPLFNGNKIKMGLSSAALTSKEIEYYTSEFTVQHYPEEN